MNSFLSLHSSGFDTSSRPRLVGAVRPRRKKAHFGLHELKLIFAALFVALIAGSYVLIPKKATVTFDFGASERVFQGEIYRDTTVLDAVAASATAGDIELATGTGPGGHTKIEMIADSDGSWYVVSQLYFNDKLVAPEAVNDITVSRADVIVLVLTPVQVQ